MSGDLNFDKVAVLLPFDTNLLDIKGNTSTVGAGASLSTADSKFGGASLRLNGATNAKIVFNHNDVIGVNSDTVFCIEFWAKLSALPASGENWSMVQIGANSDFLYNHNLFIGVNSNGFVWVSFGNTATGTSSPSFTISPALEIDTWNHIKLSNESLTLNGVSNNFGTIQTNAVKNLTNVLTIGGKFYTGSSFNGYIDDLRITIGNSRADEISPPSISYPNTAVETLIVSGVTKTVVQKATIGINSYAETNTVADSSKVTVFDFVTNTDIEKLRLNEYHNFSNEQTPTVLIIKNDGSNQEINYNFGSVIPLVAGEYKIVFFSNTAISFAFSIVNADSIILPFENTNTFLLSNGRGVLNTQKELQLGINTLTGEQLFSEKANLYRIQIPFDYAVLNIQLFNQKSSTNQDALNDIFLYNENGIQLNFAYYAHLGKYLLNSGTYYISIQGNPSFSSSTYDLSTSIEEKKISELIIYEATPNTIYKSTPTNGLLIKSIATGSSGIYAEAFSSATGAGNNGIIKFFDENFQPLQINDESVSNYIWSYPVTLPIGSVFYIFIYSPVDYHFILDCGGINWSDIQSIYNLNTARADFTIPEPILVSEISDIELTVDFTLRQIKTEIIYLSPENRSKFSNGFVNKLMQGLGINAIFSGGVIEFYSGSRPYSANHAPTGTFLGAINNISFQQEVINRKISKEPELWSFIAQASGTIGWFRIKTSSDTDYNQDSIREVRIDGESIIDAQSLNFDVVSGETYFIDEFYILWGNG